MRKPQAECADYPNAVGGGMLSPSALLGNIIALAKARSQKKRRLIDYVQMLGLDYLRLDVLL